MKAESSLLQSSEQAPKPKGQPARSGKELILATREFVGDSALRSWWAILSTALLLALSLTVAIADLAWPLRLGSSLLAGLLLVRFFVIYHDHQHHAILPRSKAAHWLMRLWGILAMTPNSIWTHSHNHHHNHNSKLRSAHIGSYPVMTRERYLRSSAKERRNYLLMRHPLTIGLGYFSIFLLGMCVLPLRDDARKHRDCLWALIIHALLYGLLLWQGGLAAAFFGLMFPFIVAGATGAYLFYAQHNFPEVFFHENGGWTYEGAAMDSSSFCRMGPLMNYFTANIGYHHIHHLNAKIPFYRLPEAYRAMPELQQAKTTSLAPGEILRCLRLKVWDSESSRLVPLGDLRNQQ